MKINEKRVISYLIVVVPLALVLTASFFITTFYIEKVNAYFIKVKEISIAEHIESKKAKSEIWVDQLNLLFDYKNNRLVDGIKAELKHSVDMAYDSARYIYEKYYSKKSTRDIKQRIIDSQMAFNTSKNPVFMVSFNGDNILPRSLKLAQKNILAYEDANHRAIILEEIQKVRKHQEGFLESDFYEQYQSYITYVKNLNMYDYYIGSSTNVEMQRDSLKSELLKMLKSIPMDRADFMGLYDAKEPILISKKMSSFLGDDSFALISANLSKEPKWYKDTLDNFYYYSKYYEPLDWYLVYGFDTSKMSKKELQKQNELEKMLDDELDFILSASAAIVIFVVVLSLLLSRKINRIFLEYQDEVQERADELERLNESLEQRVADGLKDQRQKDKMLIQQSKMAEMGDMLSMIAHQWRQPLNQMSYLIMNIDSAYEYKELTKEYLDEKLAEANDILEFMSVTIDDFRNYFRPDKSKEFVLVSDVVNTSVNLMQKSLELSGVEIELDAQGRDLTHIYKNEFIQVMLNLIKNAKDILVEKDVKNPKIIIKTRCQKEKLIVEVCDNGGGVDESIKEKIFEPYFSTKDKHNGTGLGLYMSKMIIEEHLGGSLSLSNHEDGACFRIEI
ncbi:histidine kinase [Sulfurimonas hongkongensis]|uniref:histidine kinase n=1 Tax=Sulfurimonas hongkongensis TaxID=1172190 RepID=T0KS46_9BACT|nr:cache domain-containing protein [Sulfurimonas hongkongensis]EQB39824.1 histidine kinase [Sulfurimonas hongkongensis]